MPWTNNGFRLKCRCRQAKYRKLVQLCFLVRVRSGFCWLRYSGRLLKEEMETIFEKFTYTEIAWTILKVKVAKDIDNEKDFLTCPTMWLRGYCKYNEFMLQWHLKEIANVCLRRIFQLYVENFLTSKRLDNKCRGILMFYIVALQIDKQTLNRIRKVKG